MTARRPPLVLTPSTTRRTLYAKLTGEASGKVRVSLTLMIGLRQWAFGLTDEFSSTDYETLLLPMLTRMAEGMGLVLVLKDTARAGFGFHGKFR